MFSSVSGVEKTTLDRDKGVVVLAKRPLVRITDNCQSDGSLPFEKPISMPVDDRYGVRVRYRDVIRLDPNNFAVLLVGVVHCSISLAMSAMIHEP